MPYLSIIKHNNIIKLPRFGSKVSKVMKKSNLLSIISMCGFVAFCSTPAGFAMEKPDAETHQKELDEFFSWVKSLTLDIDFDNTHIEAMLKEGRVHPDERDSKGETALMYAARTNDLPLAELLFHYGAHLDLQDTYGITALMRAVTQRVPDASTVNTVSWLLKKGANPNLTSKTKMTALMLAARQGAIVSNVTIIATWR